MDGVSGHRGALVVKHVPGSILGDIDIELAAKITQSTRIAFFNVSERKRCRAGEQNINHFCHKRNRDYFFIKKNFFKFFNVVKH